jgi:hypothetical protein
MDQAVLKEKYTAIISKREFLIKLLERSDLGTLRLDVNQALEELDELIDEYSKTFPH